MNNNFFLKTTLALFITCILSTGIFAQVAVVGSVRNGKPVVTNLADATAVLKGGLSASAAVSDIYIDLEPQSGKYYLIGRIGNDPVSGKAVELKQEGEILRAVSGPGIEVTCTGKNCGVCIPRITKWKVRCVCEDSPLQPDAQCDMTSKIVITTW